MICENKSNCHSIEQVDAFFLNVWGFKLSEFPLWERINLSKISSAYYYQKDIVGLIKQLRQLEKKWGDKIL